MKRLDRILALRFLRLPPASVPLGVPFGIAITLADDFGTPIPDYGELSRTLTAYSILEIPEAKLTYRLASANRVPFDR